MSSTGFRYKLIFGRDPDAWREGVTGRNHWIRRMETQGMMKNRNVSSFQSPRKE